ncbi:hypothetical protein L6164_018133 [Bauhinia variegata]|uniref:Uncharacterized protein n=1 Tax=Bauhinia variegata TaxID=167791 RepID=A0ACB9NF14_BAUVA|nr:hypothetical protein L6164_018133 [Bauhinia variegata]
MEMESMELNRSRDVPGSFPECGAIFMSNINTMKECFEKSIFGLPYSQSAFVGGVKEGMLLFLFEHEERKLYGLFEAISDGDTDIVPQAYTSSGKQFPAQVKFSIIWHCASLSEDEFRGAIQDNYFEKYKINYGLSKNQIQSLVWLFNSTKFKVPKPLRMNKSEDREWYYKCSTSEIEISRSKLNKNVGISRYEFYVGQQHSLCCGDLNGTGSKFQCHQAYDPDYPGYHEPATFQEEKEMLSISSRNASADVEDFIPLSSPDHSDPEEEEVGSIKHKCSGEKQIDEGPFLPIPHLPFLPNLRSEAFDQLKMENPHASSSLDVSPYHRMDDTFSALPMSDPNDSQSKGRSNHSKMLLSKRMYSDSTNIRTSAFSRLNFSSKDMSQKNLKDASVNDVSRVNQHSLGQGGKMENVKPRKYETEDCKMNNRTSVFMRLTAAAGTASQEVHNVTSLQRGIGVLKKRKRNGDIRYDVQEGGYKDDMSVSEIMEKLRQRHSSWKMMMKMDDSLKRGIEYCRMKKKLDVFSRLSFSGNGGRMKRLVTSFDRGKKETQKYNRYVYKPITTLQRNDEHEAGRICCMADTELNAFMTTIAREDS